MTADLVFFVLLHLLDRNFLLLPLDNATGNNGGHCVYEEEAFAASGVLGPSLKTLLDRSKVFDQAGYDAWIDDAVQAIVARGFKTFRPLSPGEKNYAKNMSEAAAWAMNPAAELFNFLCDKFNAARYSLRARLLCCASVYRV